MRYLPLILLIISSPLVSLTQQLDSRLINVELASTSRSEGLCLWYANISIEQQTYKLLVSTISRETWIPSDKYQLQFHGQVYPGFQDKPPKEQAYYHDGLSVDSSLHNVTMQLGSNYAPVEDTLIGVAYKINNPEDIIAYRLQGMMGLNAGPRILTVPLVRNQTSNLVENLYKKGLIERRMASLYVPRDDQSPGMLTFGGVNGDLYSGELRYASIVPVGGAHRVGWYLVVEEIGLDWSRVDPEGRPEDYVMDYRFNAPKSQLQLDSSSTLFVGYRPCLDKLLIDIMGARRFSLSGLYVFRDCRLDNKPDFVFKLQDTLGNYFDLRLEPKDYVVEHDHQNGRRYCLSGFLASDERYLSDWTLGTRFLENYYTVYDYEDSRIGFARVK